MLNTPVLFLIFNRPDTTQQVFAKIREAQPKQLFVAADGPRADRENEDNLCRETRAIIEQVDWDCEVKTLFRAENLGCGKAVYSAINWFFENVEYGIILEDDCLPNTTFFSFCETLLKHYQDDDKIMHISGSSFLFGKIAGDGSYYFSKFARIWGWATWRSAWRQVDFELKNLDNFLLQEKNITDYWKNNLIKTKSHQIDTWDFQWIFTLWLRGGKAITPNVSLVKNIGYNENATHTFKPHWWKSRIKYGLINTIKHPTTTEIDKDADRFSDKIISNIPLTTIERIKMRMNVFLFDFIYKQDYL